MIATQSGGYQGIGFALPINMVARVYNDIIKTGRVTRGSIGIEWSKADDKPELFKALGTSSGVLISKVQKGGPAEKAGLKADDIIIAMAGKPVKNGEDLVSRVSETPINSTIGVTVDRDGKHMDFNLTVLDRAEVFKDAPNSQNCVTPQPESRSGQADEPRSTSSVSSCTRSPTASAAPWNWTPRAACWSRAWMRTLSPKTSA